jgi:hypothetical protein
MDLGFGINAKEIAAVPSRKALSHHALSILNGLKPQVAMEI